MIYETIPVQYLDHTALLKALNEANDLISWANFFADDASERLMNDDVTSGTAVRIGKFINQTKNIVYVLEHCYNHLAETACECKIVIPDPGDDYVDKIEMQLETLKNGNKPIKPGELLENAFDEWSKQLPLLARKYNIPIKKIEFNHSNNGEAQRSIEGN